MTMIEKQKQASAKVVGSGKGIRMSQALSKDEFFIGWLKMPPGWNSRTNSTS